METKQLTETEWKQLKAFFNPFLCKALDKIQHSPLWYEVWIDLDETIDRWCDFIYKHPNLAAYNIARWMVARDKWYWSPQYVKELNKAQEETGDPCAALTSVLNKSLKR